MIAKLNDKYRDDFKAIHDFLLIAAGVDETKLQFAIAKEFKKQFGDGGQGIFIRADSFQNTAKYNFSICIPASYFCLSFEEKDVINLLM